MRLCLLGGVVTVRYHSKKETSADTNAESILLMTSGFLKMAMGRKNKVQMARGCLQEKTK